MEMHEMPSQRIQGQADFDPCCPLCCLIEPMKQLPFRLRVHLIQQLASQSHPQNPGKPQTDNLRAPPAIIFI